MFRPFLAREALAEVKKATASRGHQQTPSEAEGGLKLENCVIPSSVPQNWPYLLDLATALCTFFGGAVYHYLLLHTPFTAPTKALHTRTHTHGQTRKDTTEDESRVWPA